MPSATPCVNSHARRASRPAAAKPADSYFALATARPRRSHPGFSGAQIGWQLALGDNVGDGEAAARLEHPEGLAQQACLVSSEVDHAVGDHNVDGVVGQGDASMWPLRKWTFSTPAAALFARRGPASRRSCPGHRRSRWGRRDVPRAGRRCRHHCRDRAPSRPVELGQSGRIATAERGLDGGIGQLTALLRLVETAAEARRRCPCRGSSLGRSPVITASADSA